MRKHFIVKGQPQGKARPRVVNRYGFVRAFTPHKTIEYECFIKESYKTQCVTFYEATEPLKAKIIAYYQIPKSFSKKKRQKCIDFEIRPQTKPDLDNVAKVILDALNGIAYADDKQIVDLHTSKYYSEEPRVEIFYKTY